MNALKYYSYYPNLEYLWPRYSKGAGEKVEEVMHEMKEGKLKIRKIKFLPLAKAFLCLQLVTLVIFCKLKCKKGVISNPLPIFKNPLNEPS